MIFLERKKKCNTVYKWITFSLLCIARLQSAIDSTFDCRSKATKFESKLGYINFVEIDYERVSVVILPLLPIQEGQLSVTSKRMCTKY